jgi:hypothetical protein
VRERLSARAACLHRSGKPPLFHVPGGHRLSQWRLINAAGAAIILIGAVLPVAAIPLWRRRRARSVLLALCWVIDVGCVMHALVDDAARILSLAGVLHMASRSSRSSTAVSRICRICC